MRASTMRSMDMRSADGAVCRVPARVGLAGNPSDGFGGAVLSTIVPGLDACVTAAPSGTVVVAGPHLTEEWPSVAVWLEDAGRNGHVGAQRIITASLWTLVTHLRRSAPRVAVPSGVTVSWHTGIPASVGLAGSSALAVATIDAVRQCWGLRLDRRVCAALALSAERDVLGIAAGWQDRIVQAFGRTVLVDAGSMADIDGLSVPRVDVVEPAEAMAGVRLVVGWREALGSSSDDYHAPLRIDSRSLAAPMAELAEVARRASRSVELGDVDGLSAAMDDTWRIRQSSAPLRPEHAALVEAVRGSGVAATTPGSGGSVVALCGDADAVRRATAALAEMGCDSLDFALRDVSPSRR